MFSMKKGKTESRGNIMDFQKELEALIEKKSQNFDEKIGMIEKMEICVGGYHSKVNGIIHHVKDTSGFAMAVFNTKREQDYDNAIAALHKICDIQDTREESTTFGLWSYYLEEDLDHMIAHDYNWANFVAKDLIGVCILHKDKIPQELEKRLHTAIGNAMECTIKRNVSADYTNISIMSAMTLVSAGELLEDKRLFDIGKERLKRFYEYTKFNTAFSEYNSSGYIMICMHEIARMLEFFKDEECRAIAENLNKYAWRELAVHYNLSIEQISPPQMRAYKDISGESMLWYIWQGTGGKYGRKPDSLLFNDPDGYFWMTKCPEECFPLFEKEHEFISHTYYRKNNIRQLGEDTVVVREFDSPDLTAYTYKTVNYSMGCFKFCDCWNQRRNVMVVWDKQNPKTFRLRGIHNGYDFCSGVAYCAQHENHILGQLGFVTDRGSFQYILDKVKNGIYEAEELNFRFELGGNSESLQIKQQGKDFYIDDGKMHIKLHIEKWMFDGKDSEVKLSEDGRAVILVGYEGESKVIDTNKFDDTYAIFTLSVVYDNEFKTDEVEYRNLNDGRVESSWKGMRICSHRCSVPYRSALGLDALDYDTMPEQIDRVMEKLKNLQADGTVKETTPLSNISIDSWEWPQGVAMFAMYQYYKISGKKEIIEYIKEWFDRHIERGLPEQNINTTCPMLTLACLYEEEKNEKYLPILLKWLDGAMNKLPRTQEGGLQHIVTGFENKGQLWDDTLYMTVLFLTKMGNILREDKYIQESIRQFLIHIKYLTDTKSGLFYHGWTFEGNHNFANALWARGNSWYTAGLVDYLEFLDENEGVKEFLLTTLKRQAEALENCQDESGLWHTILNDSDSYIETSASAAFAYGILKAVRKGYLPARFVLVGEKAVKGVMEQIAKDGTVMGVSYGTPVFSIIQDYKEIPICPMPYGQSMTMMMLVEAYGNASYVLER